METEVEPTSAIEKSRYFNRMDEAFGILCLSISPELLFHVESCSTPNEVWKILEGLFGKKDEIWQSFLFSLGHFDEEISHARVDELVTKFPSPLIDEYADETSNQCFDDDESLPVTHVRPLVVEHREDSRPPSTQKWRSIWHQTNSKDQEVYMGRELRLPETGHYPRSGHSSIDSTASAPARLNSTGTLHKPVDSSTVPEIGTRKGAADRMANTNTNTQKQEQHASEFSVVSSSPTHEREPQHPQLQVPIQEFEKFHLRQPEEAVPWPVDPNANLREIYSGHERAVEFSNTRPDLAQDHHHREAQNHQHQFPSEHYTQEQRSHFVAQSYQPIDPSFRDGMHVVDWVKETLQHNKDDVEALDPRFQGRPDSQIQEMLQALGTALLCVNSNPEATRKGNVINEIGWWYKAWFHTHVATALKRGKFVEYVPAREYHHRHTRSLYWEGALIVPMGNHPLFRFFLGWLMPPKVSLLKLTMTSSLRNYYEQRHACQDMLIPSRKVVNCLKFCHDNFETYPLWLCPHRLPKKRMSTMLDCEPEYEKDMQAESTQSDDGNPSSLVFVNRPRASPPIDSNSCLLLPSMFPT